MARTVIAVFDSLYSASGAITELEANGVTSESLNIYSRSKRGDHAGQVNKSKRLKFRPEVEVDGGNIGAQIGSGIGAAAGAGASLLAAFGVIELPFLATVLSAGPLAGIAIWLAAMGIFAAAGGLIGTLLGGSLGLAIPEAEMQQYARIACGYDVILAVLADWNDIDSVIQLIGKHTPLTIEEKAYSSAIDEQIISRLSAMNNFALKP